MAKNLAKEIGYIYIDTGAMYRAVTLYALQNGIITENGIDAEALKAKMEQIMITFVLDPASGHPQTFLNGICVEKDIRTMEVSRQVSHIAAMGFVREAMVSLQRLMGESKGVILDGRDIGTVVFPNAELKVFVTASAEIRAKRRYDELTAKGEVCDFDDILKNVKERDHIDSTRSISPLRKAEDAIVLDNSEMTMQQQLEWLKEVIAEKSHEDYAWRGARHRQQRGRHYPRRHRQLL